MLTRRFVWGALCLSACAHSSNHAPPPMPQPAPDPTRLELPAVRVTHGGWTAPAPAALPRNARRGLTREVLQPILVSANEPVRACYKAFLAFSPQASGTISTLMHIGPEGNIIDVETVGTPDPGVQLLLPCVLNSVRSRRFPASRGHTVASFAFQFQASELAQSNGTPTVSNAPPRPNEIAVPNPDVIAVHAWRPSLSPNPNPARVYDQELAAAVVPDVTSLAETCFAAALTVIPDVAGQFTLHIMVEPSGSVARAEVNDRGQLLGPLRDCIAALGQHLQFHPAVNGADISIPVSLVREEPTAPVAPSPSATASPDGAPAGSPAAPHP